MLKQTDQDFAGTVSLKRVGNGELFYCKTRVTIIMIRKCIEFTVTWIGLM